MCFDVKKASFNFALLFSRRRLFRSASDHNRNEDAQNDGNEEEEKKTTKITEEIFGSNLKNHYVCCVNNIFSYAMRRGNAVILSQTGVQVRKRETNSVHTLMLPKIAAVSHVDL